MPWFIDVGTFAGLDGSIVGVSSALWVLFVREALKGMHLFVLVGSGWLLQWQMNWMAHRIASHNSNGADERPPTPE